MLAPPSASSPRPSEIRSSTIAASLGRLVTISRPVSRSYQRKAGTVATLPCMMPAWLAGVVDGSPVCQRVVRCVPPRSQRPRLGRLPALTAQPRMPALRPSIWMISTPGPSTCGLRRFSRAIWRSAWPRKASSLPASASQLITAVSVAAIQDATNTSGTLGAFTSGSRANATHITIACTQIPSSSAPTPPSATAVATSSGRSSAPIRATRTTSRTIEKTPVEWMLGSAHRVRLRTMNEVMPARAIDRVRAMVGRQPRSSSIPMRSSSLVLPPAEPSGRGVWSPPVTDPAWHTSRCPDRRHPPISGRDQGHPRPHG